MNQNTVNEIVKHNNSIIRKNRLFTFSLTGSIIAVILFIGIILYRIFDAEYKNVSIYVIIVIALIAAVLIFICVLLSKSVKHCDEKAYILASSRFGYPEYINEINKTVPLDDFGEGYFGFIEGKKNIKLFVFHMPCYDRKQYAKMRKTCSNAANKKYKFRQSLPASEMEKTVRVNILFLDEWSEDAASEINANAVYGMNYAESRLDIFADLSAGQTYVPRYTGLHSGDAVKYEYAVYKVLSDILPASEE